jgi:hypothetical protein
MKSEKDVAAFLWEHRKRYEIIREREWQREFAAADTMTKTTMLCLKQYAQDLMESGSGVLGTIRDRQAFERVWWDGQREPA